MTVTNEVCLQGRLSRRPEEKVLPRRAAHRVLGLVVPREEGERKGVDWIDCAVWGGRLRRSVTGWATGDTVEVQGALRRRFYRVGGTLESRVEVEARTGRLIRRADPA